MGVKIDVNRLREILGTSPATQPPPSGEDMPARRRLQPIDGQTREQRPAGQPTKEAGKPQQEQIKKMVSGADMTKAKPSERPLKEGVQKDDLERLKELGQQTAEGKGRSEPEQDSTILRPKYYADTNRNYLNDTVNFDTNIQEHKDEYIYTKLFRMKKENPYEHKRNPDLVRKKGGRKLF